MNEFPDFEKCTINKDENVVYSSLRQTGGLTMEELKICSCRCGSDDVGIFFSYGDDKAIVFCNACDEQVEGRSKAETIEAWNRRADDGHKKKQIDALSEEEAKAALAWCLDYAAEHTYCDECYEPSCEEIRKVSKKKNVCQYVILRSALKATQDYDEKA